MSQRTIRMSAKRVSKAVCVCLGLTTLLFGTWNSFTNPSSATPGLHVPSRMEMESKTLVILDYTGYIRNGSHLTRNCLITNNLGYVDRADAVVITSRRLKKINDLPKFRKPWQRWVWLLDENPHHSVDFQEFTLADFKNVYNWTMTYRSNSDVYIPYGRTQRKSQPEKTISDLGNRKMLVAAVISNCNLKYVHNSRMEYIKLLMETTPVTVYGQCGEKCQGYDNTMMHSVCPELSKYLFYLAFENSNCKEYITEKFFANGFESGTVPIVLGASKEEYTKIAPPNSFIHVKDFQSPEKLGEYLKYLASNRTAYMEYHMWRKEYTTSKRLQFITRSVWEPLCEKLNNDNGKQNIIPDLEAFWSISDCNNTVFW